MQSLSKDNTWANSKRKDIPNGIWTKCPECKEIAYNGELDRNLRVCRRCNYHFAMDPLARIEMLLDEGSFRRYEITEDQLRNDKIVASGTGLISNYEVSLIAMNIDMFGTTEISTLCGELINAISCSIERGTPLIAVFTSLFTSPFNADLLFSGYTTSINTAFGKLDNSRLPYISIISQINSSGSYPGFALIADVVIAESNTFGGSHTGSRIGRREVEKAMKEIFDKGIADMIVSRGELKNKLTTILEFFL